MQHLTTMPADRYADADGLVEHLPSSGSQCYKRSAPQKIILILGRLLPSFIALNCQDLEIGLYSAFCLRLTFIEGYLRIIWVWVMRICCLHGILYFAKFLK